MAPTEHPPTEHPPTEHPPTEDGTGQPTQRTSRRGTGRLVLVAGATGYIGRRLVTPLLDAGYRVRCLARTPAKLDAEPWRDRVDVVRGDVSDPGSLDAAFRGVHAAYYLVHAIGAGPDWERRDRDAARNFAAAAARAGTAQIVYLGGLGDDAGDALSPHLSSRHEVGAALARGPVPVTELRAAVVIGSGSASFEMLRHLVEVLPAMITPRWVDTPVQPIGVTDVLAYLVGVLDNPDAAGQVLEVGGADVVTYREMMHAYADAAGLRPRVIVPVPVLTPRLSSLWVGLVTPVPASLARPLVDSLVNPVVVRDHTMASVVDRRPLTCRDAIELALHPTADRTATPGPAAAGPMPTDPHWAGATVLADHQRRHVDAPAADVFATVCSLGGDTGWLAADALWSLRGVIDRLVGGPGMRRGRRDPRELRVGDVVDCWRVEALEPDRLVRLHAEMRLPGEAWLSWEFADGGDGTTTVDQRAVFHPRGLWGRAYWYAAAPFHRLVFAPMCDRLCTRAQRPPGP